MLGITSGAPIIIYCGKYRAILGKELGLARNFVKIFSRNFFYRRKHGHKHVFGANVHV